MPGSSTQTTVTCHHLVTHREVREPPHFSICSFTSKRRVLPSSIFFVASPQLPGLAAAAAVILAPLAYKVVQCLSSRPSPSYAFYSPLTLPALQALGRCSAHLRSLSGSNSHCQQRYPGRPGWHSRQTLLPCSALRSLILTHSAPSMRVMSVLCIH